MKRFYYEDAEKPWEPDGFLQKYEKPSLPTPILRRDRGQDNGRSRCARALDLGMGYGRNAMWLAERGYEVEGWELEGRYVREARKEWQRRAEKQVPRSARDDSARACAGPGRLRARQGDFARGDWRGPFDVIVISQALHQLKRSEALRVLRRARSTLAPGGRLFLLAKLTHDKHVRRVAGSAEWERVRGERNTWRRAAPQGRRHYHAGRPRRRWRLLSALTAGEIRLALRGLRLLHYREVVLRSDWEENEVVTHTVAEVVAQR